MDFKNELIKLIDQGVKGLVIDLRGNGGGSMEDATQILRLFTNSNEILWNVEYSRSVETSQKSGLIPAENLNGFERIFFGPLVVLIDNASVSASELSASALKSLGKAIVVGAPQSFGKGSMQIRNEIDVGGYMLTEALFFNRDGYSPQFYGVPADIVIKNAELSLSESMEKDRPNAIAPRPLFAVNESYLHVTTSVISEIPLLKERSLQRQNEIEKSESPDPVLEESLSILSDWVELLKE